MKPSGRFMPTRPTEELPCPGIMTAKNVVVKCEIVNWMYQTAGRRGNKREILELVVRGDFCPVERFAQGEKQSWKLR